MTFRHERYVNMRGKTIFVPPDRVVEADKDKVVVVRKVKQ